MLKILLPVDGSECSDRAVDFVIEKMLAREGGVDLHLLTVHAPIPYASAVSAIGGDKVEQYYHDEGEVTLKSARLRLDAAKVGYAHHIVVGDPADVIARFAQEIKVDLIVIGTRGRGLLGKMIMGSVASKVVHLAELPVLLIK
jgi:nucleotide-binding universal stress UspA family protein